MAAALKEREGEGDEAVVKTKVKRQDQEIGDEEEDISDAETGKQVVEQVCH